MYNFEFIDWIRLQHHFILYYLSYNVKDFIGVIPKIMLVSIS